MAMIEKLSIRGIRSFGDEVEEVMEFQRPLTLLVGPNGAGKTTIIESLKYVTIGKKPSSKNKDFIHDPKLKETKQVSANVKLRCRDVNGASLEVEIYVTAEQRGKKFQAQITDTRLYRDGKSVPCRRSADLDQEMVTSLGVSEAILNHVVFCYQEDSTWPLGKDTELKEKFDKIFEATRYMKALEEIRKVEKSQKEEADRESTKLKFLDKDRKTSKEIADKLEKVEDEAKEERISLKNILTKIGPVESKLSELSEKSDDICKIEEKLTSLETQTQEKSKRINQLQREIKKELKKGHDELLKLKTYAVKNLKSKEKERKMQEKELGHHCLKIREINAAFSTISAKLGKLEQKKEQAKEIMQDRDKRIKRYAKEYKIQAPVSLESGSQISESEASQFELKFKSFVANYIEDLETEKNETENKFESAESTFLSQSYEAVKLEEGIAQKKENLKEYKSSLAKVQNDLDSLESTSNTKELEAARQEFEEAQKELKKFETQNLIEKEKKFLLTLETEKTKIKGKIATQDDALNEAVKNTSVKSKLEFISNYLNEKEMLVKSKKKFQDSVVVQALHKEDTEIIKNESRKLRDKLSESTTSVDSILKERKNLLQRYYDVEETTNEIRDSIAANQESFFKLKEHVTTSWEKKIKLSLGTVHYNRLKDEEKVLEESTLSLSSRIQLDQATLSTLKTKVNKLKKEKQNATKEREAIIRKLNVQEQQLKLKQENLSTSVKNVKEVLKEKLDKRMKDSNELTQTRRESLEKALDKKEEFENKIKSFNQDIANFDVDKRNIEDNLNICEISKEIENIKAEMKQKNKQLKKINPVHIQREIASRETEWQNLNNQRERAEERKFHIQEKLNELEMELNKDEYKFADENYKESLIKSTLLSMASEDLEKYYKALDKAILKYHKIKMDEINKTMKELWQETYSGKDIDYVQIVSSDDTGPSKRRVFNYRVVMFSDGVGMNMRGRCSAGQKVLASLIIRLALAQQFCRNCGVLALDEPTTNLDKENIANLARSLINIIDLRSDQRNFQLLVITHDENFVDLLGKSRYVDHYFRVRKKHSHSHITRCLISRIFEQDDDSEDERLSDVEVENDGGNDVIVISDDDYSS